jgi:hypothetical protein
VVIQQEPAIVEVEQQSKETIDNLGKGTYEIKKARKRAKDRLIRKW